MDEKNASPVEQYGVDPERQSTRVGSLAGRSDSSGQKGALRQLWDRHWKLLAQVVSFMVFTASVTPSWHLSGASWCGGLS